MENLDLLDINEIDYEYSISKNTQTLVNKKLKNLDVCIAKRSKINTLSSRYDSLDNLYGIEDFIDNMIINLNAELSSFLSINEANEKYIIESDIDNLNSLLLTKDYAKAALAKYATVNDAYALNEQCSENRFKLMEEMTDFAAAGAINVQQAL